MMQQQHQETKHKPVPQVIQLIVSFHDEKETEQTLTYTHLSTNSSNAFYHMKSVPQGRFFQSYSTFRFTLCNVISNKQPMHIVIDCDGIKIPFIISFPSYANQTKKLRGNEPTYRCPWEMVTRKKSRHTYEIKDVYLRTETMTPLRDLITNHGNYEYEHTRTVRTLCDTKKRKREAELEIKRLAEEKTLLLQKLATMNDEYRDNLSKKQKEAKDQETNPSTHQA